MSNRSNLDQERPYVPPRHVQSTTLLHVLKGIREIPETQQSRLGIAADDSLGLEVWYAGDLSILRRSCVAIVGARKVSPKGAARARRLARELSAAGVAVVSGLAHGVDTEALMAAIKAGGRTVAVIGTPMNRAYPAANKRLQELIYREHLLISQFRPCQRVYKSNFPERNKLMAALTDATVIIEASDTSGSLHQAAECVRLSRWLFIANSILREPSLHWPSRFLSYPKTKALTSSADILKVLALRDQPSLLERQEQEVEKPEL